MADWKTAQPETVANFSATAYYFGRLLFELLGVPIGLVDVSYSGSCIEAWMSPATSESFQDTKIPRPGDSIYSPNRTPTVLFNGMLNPVIGYTIKGVIWYQGETNYINAEQYTKLLSTMVGEWRRLWDQGSFPFYYAQIAPFDYSVFHTTDDYEEKYNSAYLREAQLKAMNSIPNSGMAVLLDIGEKDNIHPMNKEAGGHRLAYWALAKTYGIGGFGFSSPTLKEMNINDNSVIITFDNAPNGITSFGKEISLFEVAGENRQFFPAKAVLARKSVVVYSEDVPKPVAVRYAFKDFIIGELFSTEGLPVSSFRTDNW
jgi:sialate O-acetylesterase